jgi:hypothetical protein
VPSKGRGAACRQWYQLRLIIARRHQRNQALRSHGQSRPFSDAFSSPNHVVTDVYCTQEDADKVDTHDVEQDHDEEEFVELDWDQIDLDDCEWFPVDGEPKA